MKKIGLIILLFLGKNLFSQTENLKIQILYNLYYETGVYPNVKEKLYLTNKFILKDKKAIKKIYSELYNIKSFDDIFYNFIDTTTIKKEPLKWIKSYKDDEFDWNPYQKQFIKSKLSDIDLYKKYFKEYINNGCCISMHQQYRKEIVIQIFKNDKKIDEWKSRKHTYGFIIPWSNGKQKNYNLKIEKILLKKLGLKRELKKPLKRKKLIEKIAHKIIRANSNELLKLSTYTYKDEIKKLETDFKIIFSKEFPGAIYIDDNTRTIQIKLHNERMLPNVNIMYFASIQNGTLYPSDSIKKNYLEVVNKIQSIKFIKNYLQSNPNSHLDIYFFDNKNITKRNINEINGNPKKWIEHEKYIKRLNWYNENNIEPDFDIKKAIKTNEHINCGCNYRFDETFIKKAIFFEIVNENKDRSIWFLLPDKTVLLYRMSGDEILNLKRDDIKNVFKYDNEPCIIFNENGEIIKK